MGRLEQKLLLLLAEQKGREKLKQSCLLLRELRSFLQTYWMMKGKKWKVRLRSSGEKLYIST